MINNKTKIYLAGHKGLVGSAILKKFQERKLRNIITVEKKFLDLRNQNEVEFIH
jgi:GDP-L-fucose synthase